jgi:hypothetical protein
VANTTCTDPVCTDAGTAVRAAQLALDGTDLTNVTIASFNETLRNASNSTVYLADCSAAAGLRAAAATYGLLLAIVVLVIA